MLSRLISTDNASSIERALLAEIEAEFPKFQIVKKSGDRLSHAIDRALRVLSLGRQSRYLTEYRTVLGDTLFVPDSWDTISPIDRIICLRHERVHLRQRRRHGLAGMALLYLFVPLPVGLAWCRARMEWEAYEETMRATAELRGVKTLRDPTFREHLIELFVGPDYLWMWPFRKQVTRWFDDALAALESEWHQAGSGSTHAGT